MRSVSRSGQERNHAPQQMTPLLACLPSQRRRKPLRIIGADATNTAGFQAQLDGVEARHVIEPEARSSHTAM
jgi:hypothetical protein